jgi:hypothetical protein
LHFGNLGFFLGDEGAQAFKFGFVPTSFGGTDFARGLVLFGLRGFGCVNGRATCFIDCQNLR